MTQFVFRVCIVFLFWSFLTPRHEVMGHGGGCACTRGLGRCVCHQMSPLVAALRADPQPELWLLQRCTSVTTLFFNSAMALNTSLACINGRKMPAQRARRNSSEKQPEKQRSVQSGPRRNHCQIFGGLHESFTALRARTGGKEG